MVTKRTFVLSINYDAQSTPHIRVPRRFVRQGTRNDYFGVLVVACAAPIGAHDVEVSVADDSVAVEVRGFIPVRRT